MCLWRTDGERFGERDLALMRLIRPHLYEIHRLALVGGEASPS